MNKIILIIKREYLTRVKKKSFLVMSIVGPILMAALMIVPTWLAKMDNDKTYTIAVVDQTKRFSDTIPNTGYLTNIRLTKQKPDKNKMYMRRLPDSKNYIFTFVDTLYKTKYINNFDSLGYDVLLFIPKNILSSEAIEMYSNKEIPLSTKLYVTKKIEKELEKQKLRAYGIDKPIRIDIKVLSNIISDDGELNESSSEITMVLSILSGVLIYFFIFMYGAQVMRGVIEEKTNRIIEVIISSVKPFQLMMGKIVGIAMVGLTQFLLWIILTFAIVTVVQTVMMPSNSEIIAQQIQVKSIMDETESPDSDITLSQANTNDMNENISDAFKIVSNINWGLMLGAFFFYFIAGYLLYASLFAAVGAAVDSEADTQQFMMPITIPLILGMVMLQSIVQNPDGGLAFWFSIIPFTSPIIMMARLPFSVPEWQVFLSMGILILTFLLTTKFAAKIYRVGILMYGKKVNYKELWKWLKY